jgi:serine/threonine-protein kinase RsbW
MQAELMNRARQPVEICSDPGTLDNIAAPQAPDFALRITLFPALDAVRAALMQISGELVGKGIGEAAANTAELVLAEVLNNIVEHAFAGIEGGQITVSLSTDGASIDFAVTDNGLPLPDGALPAGHLPEADGALGTLPEGGFGWFLIHSLARDVSYERAQGVNLLRFGVALDGGVFDA